MKVKHSKSQKVSKTFQPSMDTQDIKKVRVIIEFFYIFLEFYLVEVYPSDNGIMMS